MDVLNYNPCIVITNAGREWFKQSFWGLGTGQWGATNNGDNIMLIYLVPIYIPVRFFGSDYILVPPQSRRPTTAPRSIPRVRYINRFINLPADQQT